MATGLCGENNMNIFERIGIIATAIGDFFAKIPSEIRRYAAKAIPLVNSIKEKLDSKEAINITDMIPGTWDDSLRASASALLGGLIDIFKGVEESDVDESAKTKAKGKLLLGMSSGLVALMDKDELPTNMYDTYTQIAYSKTKKDKADEKKSA